MHVYTINSWDTEFKICLEKTSYQNNKRLAVQAYDMEDGCPYATLTVNLGAPLSGDETTHAFIDTNDNAMWGIEAFLQKNNIARPTGHYASSGYCIYPEYEFDFSKF